IWTGSQWEHLGLSQKSPDLGVLTDNRPQKGGAQKYLYHPFGDAGVWMLDNMRYVDESMEYKVGAIARKDDGLTKKYYCHPHRDIGENPTKENPPVYWDSIHGYLYNYEAATLGGNPRDGGSSGQGYGGDKEYENGNPIRVQGICPDGWHIPTDREWSELEKEIYENPSKYSSYTGAFDPPKWNNDWNVGNDETRRGTANGDLRIAFSTSCEVIEDNSGKKHPGRSHPVIQGGFNVLPVGYIAIEETGGYFGDEEEIKIRDYGEASTFWTVSKSYEDEDYVCAWARTIYTSDPEPEFDVKRDPSDRFNQYSVRCKKDD
ncbi:MULTISPECIES: FISUMP domain-containing protein, partial [unclassified Dysgonomonas]|uniref:FISUMP domain-containing protein n=1 Tax=unclassified Dysgonomonas TaxID=2630389 RepID=UPI0024746A49